MQRSLSSNAAHSSIPKLGALLVAFVLMISMSACDLFGSDDDDSGASLDGDLTFRAESNSTLSINYNVFYFYDGGTCQSSGASGIGEALPVEAELNGPSGTDCADNPGDFDGVQVTAIMNNANPDFLSMTLQLRSDGEVIDEAADPENFGGAQTWIVEAGEVPDRSN